MSAEWWGPPRLLRVRLAACGHAVLDREVPTPSVEDDLQIFDCPACGLPQSAISNYRDGVPCESGKWGEARCLKRRDLCSQAPVQRPIRALEDLLQAMSTPGAGHIRLAARSLQLGRWLQDQRPAEGLVLRAWPAGCTVIGGTLQLPQSAVLLLTGRGVVFQGSRFSGGVLVCCGSDFSGTFQDCVFNGCTVYAVHGATATLRRCTLRGAYHGAIAHGSGSTLHLDTCTIARCTSDVTAEHGAAVTAHQSRFTGSNSSCMSRDGGSCMSLAECAFVGGQPCGRTGVEAHGSQVLLRGCSIENFGAGAVANGPSAVIEVHRCHISAPDLPGCAFEGAVLMIRESLMHVARPGRIRSRHASNPGAPGTLLLADGHAGSGRSAAVQIERCSLSAPGERDNGVHYKDGKTTCEVLEKRLNIM